MRKSLCNTNNYYLITKILFQKRKKENNCNSYEIKVNFNYWRKKENNNNNTAF